MFVQDLHLPELSLVFQRQLESRADNDTVPRT